jgi:hypothetical protein
VTPGQPPLSIAGLKKALSEERLLAYSTSEDVDELDAVARYLWNGASATAMVPVLHALEVTFRNHLFGASERILHGRKLRFKEVKCWLDTEPSLLYDREVDSVEEAKTLLRKGRKELTPGRLVSKLSFGFWVGLCRSPYEQGRPGGPALWPKLITTGFPFLPKEHRSRPMILARFDELRDFRNRVFHHEPIWDRNLERVHSRAIETISWMNQHVARAVEEISTLPSIVDRGQTGFRGDAERLVRL